MYKFFKGLTSVKKKPLKCVNKKVIPLTELEEVEPLQVVTKQSARCRSNVKRKLNVNVGEEEEENNEDVAHTSGVSNISQTVSVKISNSIPHNDIFKPNTRQKSSSNSSCTKKLRHISK